MKVQPIPLFERLIIETQSHCNRDCWFCARIHDVSGKYLNPDGHPVRSRMDSSSVLDILDQAQALGFNGLVGFYHYSEPLLDDRHLQFAGAARDRAMKPYLHTNGDVLRANQKLCEQIQEIYTRIVIGLYDYRTVGELQAAKRFWRQKLMRIDIQFSTIGPSHDRSLPSIAVPRALVPKDPRMVIPDLVYPNAPCHRPFIRMIIQYDGTMCLCCEDTHGAYELGNIHKRSLEELWFSNRHVKILKRLEQGERNNYEFCRNCPQSPTGQRPDKAKLNFLPRARSMHEKLNHSLAGDQTSRFDPGSSQYP